MDLRREKDGQIDLVRLLVPSARPPAVPRAEPKAEAGGSGAAAPAVGQGSPDPAPPVAKASSSAPAWAGRITRIGLKDAGLRFADQSVDKAPPLLVEGLALAVEQFDLSGRERARVKLDARVNQRGRIAVDGTAAWAPLAVALRLDLAQLDLVPLQGWAGGQLNALLTKGAVSVAGQLNLAGQPAVARFEGDARLVNFNLFDRVHTADVINFRSIELAGMRFVSAPFSVDLRRLSLDEFFARAILGEDGQLNLKQLAGTPPADKAEGGAVAPESDVPAATAAAPAVGGSPAAETTRLPVRIDEIVIRKSRVDFSDQFIKPPYRASLTGLEGKITALAAGQRGLIDLRGQVDRSAPLAISGEVDPFGGQLFLNLAARVKGVDMPAMSPYAERYLGYELSKGKLSFDVKYLVDHGELKAENTLFLDQITFGNKVESPEALSVPVTMAVALLKNTRGEIDLNLPVSGSLNDPEFSVARIVFKVLANLIVKAVTSPFALLGAAFGGGEELSQVDFSAGLASLDEGGEKRLTALSRALTERPALTLEITGHANPEQDRLALAKSLLDRQLRAQKLAASVKKGQDSAALREIVLSAEERSAAMMALASEQGVVVAKGAAAADYEAALLARVKIGDDELRQLAERRGRGVRNWLVETGKVPVERVFVMAPKLDLAGAAGLSGRAAFALR